MQEATPAATPAAEAPRTSDIMSTFRENLRKSRMNGVALTSSTPSPPPSLPPSVTSSPVAKRKVDNQQSQEKKEKKEKKEEKRGDVRADTKLESTETGIIPTSPAEVKVDLQEKAAIDERIKEGLVVAVEGANDVAPSTVASASAVPEVEEEEGDGWDIEEQKEEEEAQPEAESQIGIGHGTKEHGHEALIDSPLLDASSPTAIPKSSPIAAEPVLSNSLSAGDVLETTDPNSAPPLALSSSPPLVTVAHNDSTTVSESDSPSRTPDLPAAPIIESPIPSDSPTSALSDSAIASLLPSLEITSSLAASADSPVIESPIVESPVLKPSPSISPVAASISPISSLILTSSETTAAVSTATDVGESIQEEERLRESLSKLVAILSHVFPNLHNLEDDPQSLEGELKVLKEKAEMSLAEVTRLSSEASRHEELLQDLRETHRIERESSAAALVALRSQLSSKDGPLKAITTQLTMAEETTKLAQAELVISREEYEKMKLVAKEEEERRVKALSLLRALRQKIVKLDKEKEEYERSLDAVKLGESTAVEALKLEKSRTEKEMMTLRLKQETQMGKLSHSLKAQYEREAVARKAAFEGEMKTIRANQVKDLTSRENRIRQLEGTVKELTQARDRIFGESEAKMEETESATKECARVKVELVELKYSMKEIEDRSAALAEELDEARKDQRVSTRDDTNLRRALAEAEARHETRSRDLLARITQLELDRQAVEVEMSMTLSERNKEIEKMRKEMMDKEREGKESLGERRAREKLIEEGERDKKELSEKIRGLDMLAVELRDEVEKGVQGEAGVREELTDQIRRASELETRLEEIQSKESNLRSNNKVLREELRKVQSGVLLSEKKRNPGVGYFATLTQSIPPPQSFPIGTSPVRSSITRSDSIISDGRSPASPLSRSGSIASSSISDLDSIASPTRRESIDSNRSNITEGPSSRGPNREDEAVNYEYLRNIIFQFLDKPQMRSQLLDVMGVILHFTPAESRRLQAKIV